MGGGARAMESPGNDEETTCTGHVIGATYHDEYWGGTYKVVGRAAEVLGLFDGVEVECVTPGGGAHQVVGERWTHCTNVGRDPRLT